MSVTEFQAIPQSTEQLSSEVVDAAIKVHRTLGPGLLKSVYEICLCHELALRGIPFARQVELPVCYDGIRLEAGLRIDILVQDRLVIELKTVEKILPIHEAQLLTYLKLSQHRLGLLLNFNVPLMKNGIKRLII